MDTITFLWKQNWNGINVSDNSWEFSRKLKLKRRKNSLSGLPIVPYKFIHHLHEFDWKNWTFFFFEFGVRGISFERIMYTSCESVRDLERERVAAKMCVHFWSINVESTSPRNIPKFALDLLSIFLTFVANHWMPIQLSQSASEPMQMHTSFNSVQNPIRIFFSLVLCLLSLADYRKALKSYIIWFLIVIVAEIRGAWHPFHNIRMKI